jgi:hypothetical protein
MNGWKAAGIMILGMVVLLALLEADQVLQGFGKIIQQLSPFSGKTQENAAKTEKNESNKTGEQAMKARKAMPKEGAGVEMRSSAMKTQSDSNFLPFAKTDSGISPQSSASAIPGIQVPLGEWEGRCRMGGEKDSVFFGSLTREEDSAATGCGMKLQDKQWIPAPATLLPKRGMCR